eukprot:1717380-Rhodomonas_salina.2
MTPVSLSTFPVSSRHPLRASGRTFGAVLRPVTGASVTTNCQCVLARIIMIGGLGPGTRSEPDLDSESNSQPETQLRLGHNRGTEAIP